MFIETDTIMELLERDAFRVAMECEKFGKAEECPEYRTSKLDVYQIPRETFKHAYASIAAHMIRESIPGKMYNVWWTRGHIPEDKILTIHVKRI